MIVCDGAVKEFVKTLEDAKAWISEHVTYSGDAQASCSGNECTASAEGSISCASAPGTSGGLFAASIASALAAFAFGRRKKA
jgi:hypothetical protein